MGAPTLNVFKYIKELENIINKNVVIKMLYTLEFIEIPLKDKDMFRVQFATYLEEIDLLVGKPIEPDFNKRFPEYDLFFKNDPTRRPFYINVVKDPEMGNIGKDNVGFFLLKIITPMEFSKEIKSIYRNDGQKIAWLTDFYLYPEHRKAGFAWKFYQGLIDLATDPLNRWHVSWECDILNKPAISFYEKVLQRIKKEHDFSMSKMQYQGKDGRDYYFYQIKFNF